MFEFMVFFVLTMIIAASVGVFLGLLSAGLGMCSARFALWIEKVHENMLWRAKMRESNRASGTVYIYALEIAAWTLVFPAINEYLLIVWAGGFLCILPFLRKIEIYEQRPHMNAAGQIGGILAPFSSLYFMLNAHSMNVVAMRGNDARSRMFYQNNKESQWHATRVELETKLHYQKYDWNKAFKAVEARAMQVRNDLERERTGREIPFLEFMTKQDFRGKRSCPDCMYLLFDPDEATFECSDPDIGEMCQSVNGQFIINCEWWTKR